jgi:hypothetical protein
MLICKYLVVKLVVSLALLYQNLHINEKKLRGLLQSCKSPNSINSFYTLV